MKPFFEKLFYLLILLVFQFGCEVRNSPIEFDRLPLPDGGVVSQIVEIQTTKGPKIFTLSANRIFRLDEERWVGVSTQEIFLNSTTTLSGIGKYLYAFCPSSFTKSNELFRSQDGVHWEKVLLPKKVKTLRIQKIDKHTKIRTLRVANSVKLETVDDTFVLVHTHHIWKGFPGAKGVTWKALKLDGLPFGLKQNSSLPPSIRNYLPSSRNRDFELITVLSEQLLVFRRNQGEEIWELVSSLSTADIALVSAPNSTTVFLIANDAIHRSEDRGEQWFRLIPAQKMHIRAMLLFPQGENFLMFVGTNKGTIWRSDDGGESWKDVVRADIDQRAILSFFFDEKRIFAASEGQGVLLSTDQGLSFKEANRGLQASIPLDIRIIEKVPVVTSSSGIFRWSGAKWVKWSGRSGTFMEVSNGRIIAGTQSGDILSGEFSAPPFVTQPPFGKKTLWFETGLRTTTDHAITHISAPPKGGQVVAWSERHGAVFNTGQSANWQRMEIIPQFESLLDRGSVVDFGIAAGSIFLVEKSNQGFRIWRSDAQATSWQEVSQFENTSKLNLGASSRTSESLVLIRDGKILLTSDGGERWKAVKGPWQAHQVLDSKSYGHDQLGVLVRTSRRLEYYEIEKVAIEPKFESHPLIATSTIDEDVLFSSNEQMLVLATKDSVYMGEIRNDKGRFSFGSTMFVTGLLSLLFAGFAFVAVRLFVAVKMR